MAETYLAHVKQEKDGSWTEHKLEEHLRDVGRLAAKFAQDFGSSDWASAGGWWHDLGKYRKKFQTYIRNASGFEREEAHVEGQKGRVDHSTAGALYAKKIFGQDPRWRILAYIIAGHHAGLADWHGDETGARALVARVNTNPEYLNEVLEEPVPDEILQQAVPATSPVGGREGFALWVRMLFSCLVDADFLDTETFMDQNKGEMRSGFPKLADLLPIFNNRMVAKFGKAETTVNRLRAEILRQCINKASTNPGLFSLTVPTGGGKTLSSMAFSLNHAMKHDKQRIIYVIPYTSIIEQTADIFRDIFGNAVVEHHSNIDPDEKDETHKSRLACENWDAPIIVTTNVQFFESLFAAKTSRVRKLHNIINSVVVLDEAQLLPPQFLQPILDVISLLVKHYGVTFVLSTATQPALQSRDSFDRSIRGLKGIQEIMGNPDELYENLKRVEVTLPSDLNQPTTWEDLAIGLQHHESVLCIVTTRADCRELFKLMPEGTIHLSALMCGAHRSKIIAEIKDRLKREIPTRVISTNLIEAGVDVDFPIVYRALAGLDSIAQAAGRCNREGRLATGKVVVFVPPKPAPKGILSKAESATKSLLTGFNDDPLNPELCRELFKKYFEALYAKVNIDEKGIYELLTREAGEAQIQFRTAANLFRLIEDDVYVPVFVLYEKGKEYVEMLKHKGPERWLMRKLQRYCVNVTRWEFEKLRSDGNIVEIQPGLFAQAYDGLYDEVLGLLTASPVYGAEALIS